MSTPASIHFSTTPARWNMMADIISDALGQTVASSGWNWNTDTPKSPGYAMMLINTRLCFATATLAFSQSRSNSSSNNVTGEAHRPVQKVVLHANWALKVTTACLLLQALVALSHLVYWEMEVRLWYSPNHGDARICSNDCSRRRRDSPPGALFRTSHGCYR
ncbi:hypothetical protein BGZ61DRAFT_468620 [Ilyonectria robusta]|uniref:uncharacterized protein n=1 Tax=Ilyonectria robusta TaxID=1079257 RepID=UPI001E8DC6A8|nr:uncharacterized protein BGZ61DRAFT_468620 [Ilyonectria robusta]KAH8652568.1 hypothetical protein BGZ61DRAFT_468620 [Ilyonectria robusta]